MKMIISPAKKMNVDVDSFPPERLPQFLEKTQVLLEFFQSLSYEDCKKLWACNDNLVELNMERLGAIYLHDMPHLTPAILSYEGIQYQYMAPEVFSKEALQYIQENLRILSGFYGVLAPFDGVHPYRLEMQAKTGAVGFPWKTLYDFWGQDLYDAVRDDSGFILNLASKEYSKCVERYLTEEDTYLTVVFGTRNKDGKVIQKGTLAKMARGDMVRYLAENNVTSPEGVKGYTGMNYVYHPELSTEGGPKPEYVFLQKG